MTPELHDSIHTVAMACLHCDRVTMSPMSCSVLGRQIDMDIAAGVPFCPLHKHGRRSLSAHSQEMRQKCSRYWYGGQSIWWYFKRWCRPPAAVIRQRLSVCGSCEFNIRKFWWLSCCKKCGCWLRAKTGLSMQRCPIGKWEYVEQKGCQPSPAKSCCDGVAKKPMAENKPKPNPSQVSKDTPRGKGRMVDPTRVHMKPAPPVLPGLPKAPKNP